MSRPPVEVRRACVDDLADLLLLWAAAREDLTRSVRSLGALPAEQLRPRLREALAVGHPTVLLARYEGEPAGYAVLRFAPVLAVDDGALHVDQLFVLPGRRRHGVGRALLAAAVQVAERSGADQMLAGAPPSARDSHRFLARLGFSPLVIRRVVATASLRRRLAGEGQRRGLEDLLSRRRSLRARAARAGWSGGWSSSRPVDDADPADADPADAVPEIAADADGEVVLGAGGAGAGEAARPPVPQPSGPVDAAVIAEGDVCRIDLDLLQPEPLPGSPQPEEPAPAARRAPARRRQRA